MTFNWPISEAISEEACGLLDAQRKPQSLEHKTSTVEMSGSHSTTSTVPSLLTAQIISDDAPADVLLDMLILALAMLTRLQF